MTPPVQSAKTGLPTVAGVPTAFTVTEPPQVPLELPFTFRPPLAPVVLSTMPLVGPLAAVPAEILRNSSLFAPIVLLVTFSAVPRVGVSLLIRAPVAAALQGLSSQTSTADAPPVAAKAGLAPVLSTRPP